MTKRFLHLIVFLIVSIISCSFLGRNEPLFLAADDEWVDSVFKSLSPEERIAQLFFVEIYPNKGNPHVSRVANLVKKYNIGGLVVFQGTANQAVERCNYYQSFAKTPLLVSIDGERGVAMRLDSVEKFPNMMTLGALQNDSLVYQVGTSVAEQCRLLGIHINFAPVSDINSNPLNPIINNRSFGENRETVAKKSFFYMKGMQDLGILAVAKHFPGHGDTHEDSHHVLPIIDHSRSKLDSIDLYPFSYLIDNGIGGIMVGHLNVPCLTGKMLPASLSKQLITNILKDSLHFQGLTVTDGLGMKGVNPNNNAGALEVVALLAGNDVLLMSANVPKAIAAIKKAIKKGILTQEMIDEKCRKILKLKRWSGLNNYKPSNYEEAKSKLYTPNTKLLMQRIFEQSATLIQNKNNLLPFIQIDTLKIASLCISDTINPNLQQTFQHFTEVKNFSIKKNESEANFSTYFDSLQQFNTVIVSIHQTNDKLTEQYGITPQTLQFIEQLSQKKTVVLCWFAIPYSLSLLINTGAINSIIVGYEDNQYSQNAMAQALFGGIPLVGKLPVSISKQFPVNYGLKTQKIRLKYSCPEDVTIQSDRLSVIDSLIENAIDSQAIPGCELLVAKNGVVFYERSYGFHTYEKQRSVSNTDIYDISTLTKIVATVPAIMRLSEVNRLNINNVISEYLPELVFTTKYDIKIQDILTHQAGLQFWIPFYSSTFDDYGLNSMLYCDKRSERFSMQVADNIFIIKEFRDTIFQKIVESPLRQKNRYRYSDLGFYFLQTIVERITEQPLNQYVEHNFYRTLGAKTLGYLPLEHFAKNQIVPSENDTFFRKQIVCGYPQDVGAAMMGGVAGHSGVFSDANDLAKLMQMYLNRGTYGGIEYFKETTIDFYTSSPYTDEGNRRGFGFDKPNQTNENQDLVGNLASPQTFGHSGVTGACAWVDPQNQFLYIFLSNRTFPDTKNKKLIEMRLREKVQDEFYKMLK